jgi:hypothetical protein
MSEEMLALVITVAIIALLFAWPAFLNFVCPPCGRFLTRRRIKTSEDTEPSALNTVPKKVT